MNRRHVKTRARRQPIFYWFFSSSFPGTTVLWSYPSRFLPDLSPRIHPSSSSSASLSLTCLIIPIFPVFLLYLVLVLSISASAENCFRLLAAQNFFTGMNFRIVPANM